MKKSSNTIKKTKIPLRTKKKISVKRKIEETTTSSEEDQEILNLEEDIIEEDDNEVYSNLLKSFYTATLDKIAKSYGLSASFDFPSRLSSGLLLFDLITHGGLVPGLYSISGPEGSAKSTLSMTILGSSVRNKIPVITYNDAENTVSADPIYCSNILGIDDISEVFGEMNDNGKGYSIVPKARYYTEGVLENFFDPICDLLNTLPDKIYRKETGQWYLVFDRTKEQVKLRESLKLEHSKELYTQTGNYWCPIEDKGLQAIIFNDSWPSMVPKKIDEEGSSNAMALIAREFSKHFPRFIGKLRQKAVVLFGVNQLRKNPGQQFGDQNYEPGGEALKFYSLCRNVLKPRSVPPGWDTGKKSGTGEEPSVYFGKDVYAYKHLSNIKNKAGTPFLEGWARVWISDHNGIGRGFDPVFDTYQYLKSTNQTNGTDSRPKKSFTVTIKGFEKIVFDWQLFKALIIAEHLDDKELKTKVTKDLKLTKFPFLRKTCFDQIKSGEGLKKHQEVLSAVSTKVNVEDDIED